MEGKQYVVGHKQDANANIFELKTTPFCVHDIRVPEWQGDITYSKYQYTGHECLVQCRW